MRSKPLLLITGIVLALGVVACGDDDADDAAGEVTDDPVTTEAATAEPNDAEATDSAGNGGGTLTFQGVTYELEDAWCGAAPEGGRQWQGWNDDDDVEVLIRNGEEPPRYTINLIVGDENWQFLVVGSAESDEAVAAADAIDATDSSIRGEGLTVWPGGATGDEQDEQAETVDFDYSC